MTVAPSPAPMLRHLLNGVVVASEVELTTLPAAADLDADVTLRLVDELPSGAGEPLYAVPDDAPFLSVWRTPGGHLIDVHDHARFLVSPTADAILVAPRADCPWLAVEQLLVDQVLPRAMHARGTPWIHASAAVVATLGAVALLGDSGCGKSTVCAALTSNGCPLLCDDSLAVRFAGDRVLALPGYPSLRLFPHAAEALALPTSAELATPRTPKLRIAAPLARDPIPLARLVILEPTPGISPTLEPLSGAAAANALARFVHRLLPDDPVALRGEFRLLTGLLARTPLFRLRFPHDFAALDDTVAAIASGPTGAPAAAGRTLR